MYGNREPLGRSLSFQGTEQDAAVCIAFRLLKAAGRRTKGFSDLRSNSNLRIAYGSIQVMFLAGTKPTGILAISFMDLISTTETLFDCSFAT